MEDLVGSTVKNPIISIALSSTESDKDGNEEEEACSICLEPFSSDDPPTLTSCKHEYHLQCILEWSQRSKECPICWQLLILKDPSCQELLAALDMERNLRSRSRTSRVCTFGRTPPDHYDHEPVSYTYTDDSDFDEHIMEHLTAAAFRRAHHFSRRQRQRSSGMGSSQLLVFAVPSDESDLQHRYTTTPVGSQSSSSSASPDNNSVPAFLSSDRRDQPPSHVLTSRVDASSNIMDDRQGSLRSGVLPSKTPPRSPQRSRPSELLSFSESLKSKFSAASARYKESITTSTRGLKEKLLARNNSVKELSKEVQREVTAGFAGVARMMERLDPTSKRTDHVSSDVGESSRISHHIKGAQDNLVIQSRNSIDVEPARDTRLNSPVDTAGAYSSVPPRVEITRIQVHKIFLDVMEMDTEEQLQFT